MNNKCELCPRKCSVDRNVTVGYCGEKTNLKIAKAMLHYGEEPVISGKNGSGAIFFSGCNMKCCFCQNSKISSKNFGAEISVKRLSEIFLELQQQGANNINLVTATHFVPQVISALDLAKPSLKIPVVYNCGGYESVETLKMLEGYVDIYLPDVKYFNDALAIKYSNAPHYFEAAYAAVEEMLRQVGAPVIKDGLMKKGVIVRHLILPNCYHDSIEILKRLSKLSQKFLVSIMRQYTPCYHAVDFKELNRRLTTFEYRKVIDECLNLGLDGFSQEKSSATLEMTPDFNLSGI